MDTYNNNNNNFFKINEYYILVEIINNKHVYNVNIINDILYLFVKNKNKSIKESFKIKIFKDKYEINIILIKQQSDIIKVCNINNLNFTTETELLENNVENIYEKYPNFSIDYYKTNNKYLKEVDDDKFIINHWLLYGKNNENDYFKYLLLKYSATILNLSTPYIKYSLSKNNTLLFVDDRYDPSFIYLLKLFLYSVDETWNINIFTCTENEDLYKNDMTKINVSGKIHFLNKRFESIIEYSNFMKRSQFWQDIKEENCLLFQYDSFCMGKFDSIFFNYNYIGSIWDHNPSILYKNMIIGNGGTSFRKTRIMEKICKKYEKKNIKKDYAEDIYFCELLTENSLHNCTKNIANKFSFENIYNDESIYAHQVYKSIKLNDLDNFMYEKLKKLTT
jgi:hypothetical protein